MSTTDPASPTSDMRFEVPDMSCAHCSKAITAEVGAVRGVENVDVDLETKRVRVAGRELVDQVILDAIIEAGYTPRLLG